MTIQGEGALAGTPTMFVRFGGCDYRCSWCDSLYAVTPSEVRENAEKLTAEEIVERLVGMVGSRSSSLWVTLSGGNPALMDFGRAPMEYAFVAGLQRNGFRVSVETQGSMWREWLSEVDHLTVSPKPPSSGMVTHSHRSHTQWFMTKAFESLSYEDRSCKIVVFDDDDYSWARSVFEEQELLDRPWRKFLSVGTDQDHLQDEYRVHAGISERYRWLCEKVAADPLMRDVRVLPQMHVIAWGTRRGV